MKLASFSAVLGAAVLVLAACDGGASNASAGADAPDAAGKPAKASTAADEARANDMVLGSADAPVTIIEYASVTCPACASFHETVFPAIKERYVDTGKVKFVFREFPTPPAEFSLIGSVLARCAAERGGSDAYFLVLGSLFKTQRDWIYGEDPKAELLKIAAQTGMDETAFDACLRRQELVDLVNANVKEGSDKFGVNSTPSFVIDGKREPVRSVEDFEKLIEAALAKAAG